MEKTCHSCPARASIDDLKAINRRGKDCEGEYKYYEQLAKKVGYPVVIDDMTYLLNCVSLEYARFKLIKEGADLNTLIRRLREHIAPHIRSDILDKITSASDNDIYCSIILSDRILAEINLEKEIGATSAWLSAMHRRALDRFKSGEVEAFTTTLHDVSTVRQDADIIGYYYNIVAGLVIAANKFRSNDITLHRPLNSIYDPCGPCVVGAEHQPDDTEHSAFMRRLTGAIMCAKKIEGYLLYLASITWQIRQ